MTDGRYLYAYFGSFGLYCCDFEGRLVWKRDFEPQAMEDSLGEGSSPALCGDTLVIVVDQELQSYVLAINELDETFYASPAIVGNAIYLRGDKHLFCFTKPLR